MLYVDLGGIGQHDPHWTTVNSDESGHRAAPNIVADIRECAHELELYFYPASVDGMRCVHTLEHLAMDDVMPSLKYWRTFMRPGATLLIVVPDLGEIARQYARGEVPYEVLAALAHGDTPSYRKTGHPTELHRWSWDERSLKRDMELAGYVNVQMAGDEHWPPSWTFDYPAYAHTHLLGLWQVSNLRMVGAA